MGALRPERALARAAHNLRWRFYARPHLEGQHTLPYEHAQALDAAGAPIPEFLDGASLLRLVRGEAGPWWPYLDLEHSPCYAEDDDWTALTDGEWKYIFHAGVGREQLFYRHADPGERDDLAPDAAYAETLALWRARRVAHLSERGEAYVRNGRLVAPRPSQLYSPFYHSGYPARA